MIVAAWVMLNLVGDKADAKGGSDSDVRWQHGSRILDLSMPGAARDKRVCLLTRMLERLETTGGWNHTAKHSRTTL